MWMCCAVDVISVDIIKNYNLLNCVYTDKSIDLHLKQNTCASAVLVASYVARCSQALL
jgi:hypothetical protein